MPTHREPDADNISPSFIGVSTPSEVAYAIPRTIRNPTAEKRAFFNLAPSEKRPSIEKIKVAITAIPKIN